MPINVQVYEDLPQGQPRTFDSWPFGFVRQSLGSGNHLALTRSNSNYRVISISVVAEFYQTYVSSFTHGSFIPSQTYTTIRPGIPSHIHTIFLSTLLSSCSCPSPHSNRQLFPGYIQGPTISSVSRVPNLRLPQPPSQKVYSR